MSGFNRLLQNSIANIINGFSNVILGIIISPFLLKKLSIDEFSMWSICLQAGIAISIFAMAGQITVGRFTSKIKYQNNANEFERLINNYFNIVFCLFIFCLFTISIVTFHFEDIFSSTPEYILFESQIAFILIAMSFALGIFATIFIGYFIGIEKNHITAKINIVSRIFIGVFIVLFAEHGLIAIASIYFAINLVSYLFLYKQFKKVEKHTFKFGIEGKIDDLIKFFAGLTIWNVAQFLISGIGVFVVSIYDFDNLAFFVLAMTMVNAIVGLLGAVVNPVIQPIVKLNEAGKHKLVDELILSLSLIFSLIVLTGVNISGYLSLFIMQIWVGSENGLLSNQFFNFLLVAFSIRMVIAPYGMKLVANAQQLKIAHYPIIEGMLNLAFSLYFVQQYGAIGVAYATLLSALIIMLVYAIKYTRETSLRGKTVHIFIAFILLPIVCMVTVYLVQELDAKKRFYLSLTQLLALLPIGYCLKKHIIKMKGIVNETKAIA